MHGGFAGRSATIAIGNLRAKRASWRESACWRADNPQRAAAWAIDLGLLTAAIAGVLTQEVVLWFHLIFVLVVVAALQLPFRPFVMRLVFWSFVSTGLVIWAVARLETPSQELIELPILTFVLVLVFLGAQSRARSYDELQRTQREIDMRTLLERETMRTQLEESQLLDMLGRTSIKTAHEIRNVLTIVRGCAAELGEEPSTIIRHKADELVDAVDRGLEMLAELMAAGRTTRTPTGSLDLGRTLQQAEVLLTHLLHDDIEMLCEVPSTPLEVELDRTRFTQIVMNLVANAVDAVGDCGKIDVAVREVVRHRAGAAGLERCAVIEVADNGAGMEASEDGDVFDPGFTTKGRGHSGLGLSMVWQIAAQAGGDIEIDSKPGAGTTMRVFLPLADSRKKPRRCVLFLEDERALRMIAHEFDLLGYEVQRGDDSGHSRHVNADFAVVDAGHAQSLPIGTHISRVVRLDSEGSWRPPATPADAAQLVRRIVMDGSTVSG